MKQILQLTTIAMITVFIIGGCKQKPAHDDHEVRSSNDTTQRTPRDDHSNHDDYDVEHRYTDLPENHDEHDEDTHDEHAGHDDHGVETEEILTVDQRDLREFGIKFETAKAGILRDVTSLVGEIVLNPDQVAHVVSRADGIGMVILHTIGDHVTKGETLAVIESPALAESKAEYLSKAALASLAALDLDRAEIIYSNTIQLLDIIASNPDVDTLRKNISGLDIGARRGNLITTYAELCSAEAVYAREKTLYTRQITSEYEYLRAESELKKTMAIFQAVRDDLTFANRRELDTARRASVVTDVLLQAARRRLFALGLKETEVQEVENEPSSKLARYEIRSPIKGVIIERHLVQGESIDAGEQVFVVVDLSSVWGNLTLYQRELSVVQQGQIAKVYTPNTQEGIDVEIDYVGLIIDEATRTATARVVLDNTSGDWRPGMFIRAEVVTRRHSATVIVARTAIQEIEGENVIFVQTDNGLEHREVQLGNADSDDVEILSGLTAGERFVISGGLALKAELNKAALEHAGHAH